MICLLYYFCALFIVVFTTNNNNTLNVNKNKMWMNNYLHNSNINQKFLNQLGSQQDKLYFTQQEQMELLRLHNEYRGTVKPSAANMLLMEWDDCLAYIAQQWADNCEFRHDLPSDIACLGTRKPVGQNLYYGRDRDGTEALRMWFEEYVDYNFRTGGCWWFKLCGHYTQMAAGATKFLGCGIRTCEREPENNLIVCQYFPQGYHEGEKPYRVGKPCSLCFSDGGGLCANNLCVTHEQCARNPSFCANAACTLECQNCGILDQNNCRCHCPAGWDLLDCSVRCENDHPWCGRNPGFGVRECSLYDFKVQHVLCRKMCHQCRTAEYKREVAGSGGSWQSLNSDICCGGKSCSKGQVLDLENGRCTCRLLCPGPLCYDYSAETKAGKFTIITAQILFFLTIY